MAMACGGGGCNCRLRISNLSLEAFEVGAQEDMTVGFVNPAGHVRGSDKPSVWRSSAGRAGGITKRKKPTYAGRMGLATAGPPVNVVGPACAFLCVRIAGPAARLE